MALSADLLLADTLHDLPRLLQSAEGWNELIEALAARNSGTIDGAWASSAALAVSTLARSVPETLLVVVPHAGDLEAWGHDLLSFTGSSLSRFPQWEVWPPERRALDEVHSERLRLVQQLQVQTPKILLTTMPALMQPVPSREELQARGRIVRVGQSLDLEPFALWLVERGYKRVEAVEYPGEFSRRGGIFDLYSPDSENPVRFEFFGDEIESIRGFSAQSQRSLGQMESCSVLGLKDANDSGNRGNLCEFLPTGSWAVLVEPSELQDQGKAFLENVSQLEGLFNVNGVFAQLMEIPNVTLSAMPRPSVEQTVHLRVESVERFSANVTRVAEELDSLQDAERVLIACHNEAEIARLTEVLSAGKLAQSDRLRLVTGSVHAGFRLVESGVVVLGSHELFHREQAPAGEKAASATKLPRRRIESRAIDSFMELREGDYVVHVSHGIAKFRGMKMLPRVRIGEPLPRDDEDATEDFDNPAEENLVLEFREGALLYVPVSKIDLIQKYVGGSKAEPQLSKLGSTSWGKKKDKAEEAVRDLAVEMIELQALRAAQPGFAFGPDSEWQNQFEATFPFQETPDQLLAINDIRQDLENPRPMDRLLCGDVGYGKTEVAVRAAFKCIDNGKQVAVLVPTTVLAEQHYRTFSQRLAEYPFTVEVMSRFRTGKETREVVKRIQEGAVDVVIGTHRLLSKDVAFKDLGLVVIDEEQRFGVDHKEKLKQLRAMVHILTMSATPIPRTLHFALLGIRDISNLETPPPERLPVETRIIRWDDQLIRHAIMRELNRDGQVYFVHNRVQDIEIIARNLQTIIPEARIVIGHGQMDGHELEKRMLKFVRKEAEILVATTIIESGLDIPNANTIFINEADMYGLADLHQLRGRVGRQKNRAYAYLILDSRREVSETAAKRLKAIEEFTELGAGFKIAMRDLEIRGAGNLLGKEQSGHIASVGYELYCQMLENAVREKKNMPLKTPLEVHIDLPWPAFLPREYVTSQKLRMEVYRRLSRLRDPRKIDDFRQELRDRYGPIPEPTEWLLRMGELRMLASRWQISGIHRDGPNLVLSYRQEKRMQELVTRSSGRIKIIDDKVAYCRITPEEESPKKMYPLLKKLLRAGEE
jgi:transcription-repair coupling factor (superfamily II helicase)